MNRQTTNRTKYLIERWIQQGARQQLLMMVALVAAVAAIGGLLAWIVTPAFDRPAQAIWWAFLRLTDPGYLGDDQGPALRTISTVVTVLGYVLFMGSLIAILTQWLNRTMRRLESGLTPISVQGHILILGWTNRTPSIVRELALSEGRVRRFLHRRGIGKLRIVILAEDVTMELREELWGAVGTSLRRSQIVLRSGSSMRIDHLNRVDFARAAAIVLPGSDYEMGGVESMDSRVIKTLMSISRHLGSQAAQDYPVIVSEVLDTEKVSIAEQAYQGRAHVLSSDAFISRLVAQNVRHRGLSYVYSELLSHTHGNEVYVRTLPEIVGARFGDLQSAFPRAVLLGVSRPVGTRFQPVLAPASDFTIESEDRLVVIARSFDDVEPEPHVAPPPEHARTEEASYPEESAIRRVLILGWNQRVPALAREFGSYPRERFEIDVVSVIPSEERDRMMERVSVSDDRLRMRQIDADFTVQTDLRRLAPGAYDNIVFLGSDWLDSGEESDARTILGYLLLRSILPSDGPRPEILVELKDPQNEQLFRQHAGEVIISPVVLSHMLAHAALRQELTSIFAELFGPDGAEISFRPASDYALSEGETTFQEIQAGAAGRREIALGVRLMSRSSEPDGGVAINPGPEASWRLTPEDEVVVLRR